MCVNLRTGYSDPPLILLHIFPTHRRKHPQKQPKWIKMGEQVLLQPIENTCYFFAGGIKIDETRHCLTLNARLETEIELPEGSLALAKT